MMIVTDKALKHLAAAVDRTQTSEAAVRIVTHPEGWAMKLDEPRPEDEMFDHDERTVLVLAPAVAERLQDNTLDVHDTPEGPRLKLR